jgi:flagellar operon protein
MAGNLPIQRIGSTGAEMPSAAPAPALGKDQGFAQALRELRQGNGALPGQPQGLPQSAPVSAPLKFSAHALERIRDRSIPMGPDLMGRLEKAVDTAAKKGAKDSLILSQDTAFIVSVKNKTVITVLDKNQMNGNVFTNIDSTVLI